jgi:hypothetical protein
MNLGEAAIIFNELSFFTVKLFIRYREDLIGYITYRKNSINTQLGDYNPGMTI